MASGIGEGLAGAGGDPGAGVDMLGDGELSFLKVGILDDEIAVRRS